MISIESNYFYNCFNVVFRRNECSLQSSDKNVLICLGDRRDLNDPFVLFFGN